MKDESRAIYRAALAWGIAAIKWKTALGKWVGSGAVDNPMTPIFWQESRIRDLLGMNGDTYERWKR